MQQNANTLSERERLRQLEQFRDMLMPNLSNMERNMFGALNQISFSVAAIVEALKAKGVLTDEEIKVEAEKLKKVIEEQQKQSQDQNKIIVPGQQPEPKVVSQEELSNLKADLGTTDGTEEKETPKAEETSVPKEDEGPAPA